MKKLLIIILLSSSLQNVAQASCTIKMKLKSPKAKSAHLNGVSFSGKHLEALKSICTLELIPLSKEEKIQIFIDKLEASEKGAK